MTNEPVQGLVNAMNELVTELTKHADKMRNLLDEVGRNLPYFHDLDGPTIWQAVADYDQFMKEC